MADLILHHYPASPFSEKIRLMLGAKQLTWKSVTIPSVMPKPEVLALTGGYRKTPILQIGADIYCDSALIAKKLEEWAPTPSLYPVKQAASALALSQWVDTHFFQVTVAHVFQPANIAHMFSGALDQLDALVKDRAAMRANGTLRHISSAEALATTETFLSDFDRQLASGVRFAAGEDLSIADFSIYHCLWFMRRAPGSAKLIEPFVHIAAWMQRIADFGHGEYAELESSDAIRIAQNSDPQSIARPQNAGDIHIGDPVEVLPTDYGRDPSQGTLVSCSAGEYVIRRIDSRATDVFVHFPRLNYELRKAS